MNREDAKNAKIDYLKRVNSCLLLFCFPRKAKRKTNLSGLSALAVQSLTQKHSFAILTQSSKVKKQYEIRHTEIYRRARSLLILTLCRSRISKKLIILRALSALAVQDGN